jgi:hypothetical protein
MAKVRVRVIVVAVGHELQTSPPEREAPTNVKSPEVQDVFAGGNVCANEAEILSKLNIKKANSFFEIVIFDFIQLNLVEYFFEKMVFRA